MLRCSLPSTGICDREWRGGGGVLCDGVLSDTEASAFSTLIWRFSSSVPDLLGEASAASLVLGSEPCFGGCAA